MHIQCCLSFVFQSAVKMEKKTVKNMLKCKHLWCVTRWWDVAQSLWVFLTGRRFFVSSEIWYFCEMHRLPLTCYTDSLSVMYKNKKLHSFPLSSEIRDTVWLARRKTQIHFWETSEIFRSVLQWEPCGSHRLQMWYVTFHPIHLSEIRIQPMWWDLMKMKSLS